MNPFFMQALMQVARDKQQQQSQSPMAGPPPSIGALGAQGRGPSIHDIARNGPPDIAPPSGGGGLGGGGQGGRVTANSIARNPGGFGAELLGLKDPLNGMLGWSSGASK